MPRTEIRTYDAQSKTQSGIICVVEESKDIQTIDATHEYHGLYHVLEGAISPIDGIGPRELRIPGLLQRTVEAKVTEVIVATNATVEGEATAIYLAKALEDSNVRVTRLAFGLPVGGDLEYADRLTLARALHGRNPL